jgi:hypothetical protein
LLILSTENTFPEISSYQRPVYNPSKLAAKVVFQVPFASAPDVKDCQDFAPYLPVLQVCRSKIEIPLKLSCFDSFLRHKKKTKHEISIPFQNDIGLVTSITKKESV